VSQALATSAAGSQGASVAFHVATLLALLRAGEQSAALAFNRIAHRLSAGELALAAPQLIGLIDDEERHDAALVVHCATLPSVIITNSATRRFFRGLESREATVHLARIAALDACVCQVLSRLLARADPQPLGEPLRSLLARIRADEARHVRVSRDLARLLGADTTLLRLVNAEVRHRFAPLLESHASAFEALGVDHPHLIATIRREY